MCDKVKYESLEDRVDGLEDRLCNVEGEVAAMRGEVQQGFTQLNNAVANLANEFGVRMNTLDARIVEEKAKWGDTLRGIVKWTVRALLAVATAAAGVNLAGNFVGK